MRVRLKFKDMPPFWTDFAITKEGIFLSFAQEKKKIRKRKKPKLPVLASENRPNCIEMYPIIWRDVADKFKKVDWSKVLRNVAIKLLLLYCQSTYD